MLDFVFALTALIICSPVLLILSLMIRAGSPGDIFFRQKRVGKNKEHFEILKFRSMRIDTPKDVPTHLLENPEQWVTPVGKFMRKTSLDELPQLFNILRGEMSFVGPRPALWNQFDLIEERDKYGANDVYPGLTGWAQVNGRDELEIPVKAAYDGYYVQHLSFLMDLKCFWKTISVVAYGKGNRECGKADQVRDMRSQKKILFLTNHSYMFWQFRRELVRELMKRNEVVLGMPFVGHEEDFLAMGIKCIEIPINRRGKNPLVDVRLINTYRRVIRSEKPDLVITYSIKPNIYAGWVCQWESVPYYANVQGLGTAFQKKNIAAFVTLLYRSAFRHVEKVFFENESNAEEFVRRGIVPKVKQVLLHGAGINLEHFRYERFHSHDKVHFLYLGRIMREKGIDELLAAARTLHVTGVDFILDVVGFYEEAYQKQIKEMETAGYCVFHGFQQDPRPYYGLADCVVMPSYHEGMSNVLLEACAVGRPVITTDVPGCREAVDEGVNGLLVPAKDSEALFQAMKSFLSYTREEMETMGLAGRRKMEIEYDRKEVVRETVEALGI